MFFPTLLAPPVRPYWKKVIDIAPGNLVGYWPLWEKTGGSAQNWSRLGPSLAGAYTSVTLGEIGIGDGRTSILDDGINGFVNIYSASLAAAFSGAAGTAALWFKAASAGTWTDSTFRTMFKIRVDANNTLSINKNTTNNQLGVNYTAGSTASAVNWASGAPSGFILIAVTWDKAADAMKAYQGATQQGTTQTGLGTWVGTPITGQCVIGATNTTPTNVTDGYIQHVGLWNKALSAAQIAALAKI